MVTDKIDRQIDTHIHIFANVLSRNLACIFTKDMVCGFLILSGLSIRASQSELRSVSYLLSYIKLVMIFL
jgi:hypothetical protein